MERTSELLLGRYQAMSVYAAVARLSKPEFTTGQISAVSGVPTSALSKELARLVKLEVIHSVSRRGDYERADVPSFWSAVELLAQWADARDGQV